MDLGISSLIYWQATCSLSFNTYSVVENVFTNAHLTDRCLSIDCQTETYVLLSEHVFAQPHSSCAFKKALFIRTSQLKCPHFLSWVSNEKRDSRMPKNLDWHLWDLFTLRIARRIRYTIAGEIIHFLESSRTISRGLLYFSSQSAQSFFLGMLYTHC